MSPAVEAWSLNHWMAREVPYNYFFFFFPFWLHCRMWNFPDQGSNPHPLQWKHT